MKKFWTALYCALGVVLSAGTAQAACWQVVRDTFVHAGASADSNILGTLKKGWIVSDLSGDGSTARWIKVVEFEKNPGEGMAYAYMIFNSPNAFVSAADVIRVNEDGTSLLQTESMQSELGQDISINFLSAPQTDDAALKTALETWVQKCNAVLSRYQAMEPEKAAADIMSWEDEAPFSDKDFEAVEKSVAPLLERWVNAAFGFPKVPLSADDLKMFDMLAEYGLIPDFGEGSAFLMPDVSTLRKRISFNSPVEEYAAYMKLADSQPQKLFSDGACLYSVTDMGIWAMQWELFLRSVDANSIYFNKGKYRFIEFANFILFSLLPNTPAFPEYNGGKMTAEWLQELETLVKAHPEMKTAELIREFVKTVKANGNKLSQKNYEKLLAKMTAIPETIGIGR